ncbi:MAG: AtpZ/AtpI family protein [Firmicutes bacterium]|nr:AtpZ/AtpI family protein [Candidatus Fermentithermobacillaceae bacterium]
MDKKARGFIRACGIVLNLGFSIIGSSLIGMYLGSLLDKGRSTQICTPIGLLIGLAVGLHRSWQILGGITKNKK